MNEPQYTHPLLWSHIILFSCLISSFFCLILILCCAINLNNFLDVISISEKDEEINVTPPVYILQFYSAFFSFPLKTMHTDTYKPCSSTTFSFFSKRSSFFPTSLAPSTSFKKWFCAFLLSNPAQLTVFCFLLPISHLFPIGILVTFSLNHKEKCRQLDAEVIPTECSVAVLQTEVQSHKKDWDWQDLGN